MTLEQIAALTVEDVYKTLLDRILDLSVVPEGEEWVTLHEDEELPFYDRLIIHPTLVKPSMELLEAELVTYKAELTIIEEARLAEEARIEDFTARLAALKNLRSSMGKAGLNQPNAKVLVKRIIEENDLTALEALEATASSVQDDEDAEAARIAKLAAAKVELQAVDPLTINTGDAVKLLKEIVIVLQETIAK